MQSICKLIKKQRITICEPSNSDDTLLLNEKSYFSKSLNFQMIKCALEQKTPTFSDLHYNYLNYGIMDTFNQIPRGDNDEYKNVLIPFIKLRNDTSFNKLFANSEDAMGVVLINTYKLRALSVIFKNIALNIMFDLATNGNKTLTNPSDFYQFLQCLRTTIQNTDLYLLIRLGKLYDYNCVVFRDMEPNSVYYKNTSVDNPLLLFKYISVEDIKFCKYFDSFEEFRDYINEQNDEIKNMYCER